MLYYTGMKSESTTVKLSLGSLVLLCVGILAIGALGAFIGAKIASPRIVQQTSDSNHTVVPISQEITVSPSKLITDIASSKSKSVVVLAHQSSKGITAFATGVIITNDGVILSPQDGGSDPVVAIGDDTAITPVTHIGQDSLTGLHFFKLDHALVTPIELSQTPPQVGASLAGLLRTQQTMRPGVALTSLAQIIPPSDHTASGIQQVGIYQPTQIAILAGTPLLNEDGTLSGIVSDTENHVALLVPDIKSAISRLSSSTLASNPYTDIGFTITWNLAQDTQSHLLVQAAVQSVTPGSFAAKAGLKSGDSIISINNNAITWDSDIQTLIAQPEVRVDILRSGKPQTIVITKQAS